MKHFMLPKNATLRDASSSELPCSSSPSSAKPRPSNSRKHKPSKENEPPSDPNIFAVAASDSKPSPAKLKSPLPPRPPSSNPLKRKLSADAFADNSVPTGSSDSGVRVVVRMRPLCKDKDEEEPIVQKISDDSVSINGQTFTFDSVADMEATQLDVFEHVGVPLVENCLAGFNSSVFAYGQTGSGKTYTMWGPANALSEENAASEQRGLTPRVFERLFARINEEQTKHSDKQLSYQCHCSFLEIYNEQITDLLDPNQRNLQIREDVKSGVYVENLTEEQVSTMKDVTRLLLKGFTNRRVGATSINSESSRSHTVFTCVVEFRCKSSADGTSRFKTSRINLVDLAGSERQKLTGAAGERLKEAGNINRSLSQLGNLINILAEISQTGKQRHIPYRDSRLTFLLQESLGGNAKLAMICAISPAQSCRSETFSTLRFAQRAKAIKNKAVVNEVMQEDVNQLREVIRQLRDELHRIKANGYNPADSNGGHSAAWIRRSLNLLQSSLSRPLPLSRVDEDGDQEMEIDEEGVHEDDTVSCSVTMLDSFNVAENDKEQDMAKPCDDKNTASCSGNRCLDEKLSSSMVRTSFSLPVGESYVGDFTGFPAPNSSSDSPNATMNCATSLSIVPSDSSPFLKSPTLSISPRLSSSRKSLRSSSGLSPSEKDLDVEREMGIETGNRKSSSAAISSQTAPNFLSKTENLAASIRHGLEILDGHRRSAALRRSSYSFSLLPRESRLVVPANKVDVGVQTFLDNTVKEDSSIFTCSNCKNRMEGDADEADNNSILQLVPVDCPNSNLQLVPVDSLESADMPKKQVLKAVEKVLAGSIRREMALEEFCAKQNYEIMQLNRLVQQYKHERECNAIVAKTREDKILRLESLMDGVLPSEDFMDEEHVALAHEHKLLKEKFENHPEVLKMQIELKRVRDELEEYQSFYKLGEREVLLEEIQSLRSQLQFYIDSSSQSGRKQYPLLQLTNSSQPRLSATLTAIPESTDEATTDEIAESKEEERADANEILASSEESAEVILERERIKWTEAESRWICLSEELRAKLEANRLLAEKTKQELDAERKCSEELQEAMHMAIEGHARLLEQYADLEEKHIHLLARHRNIQQGIEDVKKAASRAGVRGAESKFINALAAEISALKAEREKERRILRDENRGLQSQLKDTAEAMQAAGELLLRLREAEEAVTTAQKRAMDAEQEASKAYKQMEKLKKKHEKEISELNVQLAETRAKELMRPAYDDDLVMPIYDEPQSVHDHLEHFDSTEDGELAKLAEPSWFSGYDRCNI
ncbi:TRAFAC class myosin-kinesin ATPase superfamily [Stylosanthes scabra]|uniref:TRAFAC class myosin-kinesin ATPase superfamily n=1 Tax=Stylosanthes scabra TaxID=79078 RepID=A0ABU6YFI8_9FABA|nr:TRAFAC class myosin-kinesin ATPase superfamily [Stylosanthes scabra]